MRVGVRRLNIAARTPIKPRGDFRTETLKASLARAKRDSPRRGIGSFILDLVSTIVNKISTVNKRAELQARSVGKR